VLRSRQQYFLQQYNSTWKCLGCAMYGKVTLAPYSMQARSDLFWWDSKKSVS